MKHEESIPMRCKNGKLPAARTRRSRRIFLCAEVSNFNGRLAQQSHYPSRPFCGVGEYCKERNVLAIEFQNPAESQYIRAKRDATRGVRARAPHSTTPNAPALSSRRICAAGSGTAAGVGSSSTTTRFPRRALAHIYSTCSTRRAELIILLFTTGE